MLLRRWSRRIALKRKLSLGAVIILTVLASLVGQRATAENDRFQYVAPSDVPSGFAPKTNWLPLTTSAPSILLEEPPQNRGTRLYTLLRYGTPDSTQVVLILDDNHDRAAPLYVDEHRTGRVGSEDLASRNTDRWQIKIETQIPRPGQPPETFSRQVEIRRSASGTELGIATVGFMEGSVSIAGKQVNVRRVDGNGNGLFADPEDRLWFDLDGDGAWDPFAEQFPFAPILNIAGKRLVVRSDLAGEQLSLDEVTGSGVVRVQLEKLPGGSAVRELEVALMGDDGSAYAARADGMAIEVPEGRFAVRSLRIVLLDEVWQREWCYVFSRTGDPQPENWHHVQAGQTVTIDPVGQLRLTIEGVDLEKSISPGRQITVQPRLTTQDGLLINGCDVNKPDPIALPMDAKNPHAEVELCLDDGRVASSYQSGFS